jgi:hypothetical protein
LTRRPLIALVAAAGVTAFLIVVDLLQLLVYLVPGRFAGSDLGQSMLAQLEHELAVGVGVFLVLWLLLPANGPWTLTHAIGAGALAAVVAAVVVGLVDVLQAFVFARSVSGSLYDLIPLNVDPVYIVTSAIITALTLLPLTVLAAVLVREWLRSKAVVDAPKEPAAAV